MRDRSSIVFAATATAVLLVSSPASAQGGGGGGGQARPLENIQVLPKDIRRDSLTGIMRGFTAALGVQCAYCHTPREGAAPAGGGGAARGAGGATGGGGGGGGGGPQLNHALDDKETKKTARVMMRMVDSINNVHLKALPAHDNAIMVTCATCHRGVAKPMTIDAVIAASIAEFGVDSAIVRYRALRADLYAGKYDFREQPVTAAALRLVAASKLDDAMKLLQMNQEFWPASTNIDFEIAEILLAKGDREAGIARLRAVLVKNPNDRRARARLTQLGIEP